MNTNRKAEKQTETESEKTARWAGNAKLAKAFAKQAGLLSKAKAERAKNNKESLKYSSHPHVY